MKDSQRFWGLPVIAFKYIKADNERFSTFLVVHAPDH